MNVWRGDLYFWRRLENNLIIENQKQNNEAGINLREINRLQKKYINKKEI